tara:strand:- start:1258 stop:1464 length:207 start_codon:yes stop_codon:yes gene_type:complete
MIDNIKVGDLVYVKRKINSITSKFICTVLSIKKADNYYEFVMLRNNKIRSYMVSAKYSNLDYISIELV